MILQLTNPLPMKTPKGNGIAHFVIDYGCEENLIWVVFLDSDGECWSFPNSEVRIQENYTMMRRFSK